MVKVRFAPSPTGYLHIGGGRTALFNWLYAMSKGGKFVLRIEDTDVARSKKEYLDEILDSLTWLGFKWDELYFQSQRFDIYRGYAAKLLAKGLAYKDGEAVIFKVIPEKIKIMDQIHGEIEFDTGLIKDQVLIKSDLSPTYNFACVIDDASMGITHIIRGDDHISNTPKQLILYKAMEFPVPEFAHLPLILGTEGGRLSKRTGAAAISDYRKMGYLPQALANYLLLLGWSPGGNQELIDINEAIKKFDIKDVNKTAAAFNMEKLNWINAEYIRKLSPEKLLEELMPLLAQKQIAVNDFDSNFLLKVVKLFQQRIYTLQEFSDFSGFFFREDFEITPEAEKRLQAKDYSKEFNLLIERFKAIENFDHASIEQAFRSLVAELEIKAGELVHPVRAALTGKTIGPGLFELIEALGKPKTEQRLRKYIR